jgi:hypothetical protein
MLIAWDGERAPVKLITSSGAPLTISFNDGIPSLAGEGRLVFQGALHEILPAF